MRKINIKIHPSVFIVVLYLIFTEQYSYYLFFLSTLIVHEFGHITATLICRFPIKHCIFHLYGAQLDILYFYQSSKLKQLAVILAGPAMTLMFAVVLIFLNFPDKEIFIQLQWQLLLLNLLPIYPLDGGQVIRSLFENDTKELLLLHSIILSIVIVIIPYSPWMMKFILIWITLQNIQEWKYRHYDRVLRKLLRSKLT